MLRVLAVVLLTTAVATAAPPHDLHDWIHGGCKHGADELVRRVPADIPLDRATRPIDVQHVDLQFAFEDTTARIDARMQARVVVLERAAFVDFDLESDTTATKGLRVTGAWAEGQPTTFAHFADTLRIDLPQAIDAGDTTTVAVTYRGIPIEGRFPGYGLRRTEFLDEDFQNDPERPVLQTLSQPTGARLWWPSHDHPADAATVRLTVTCPPGFELAAPGRRESIETLGDGRVRQTNFMPHPIPSYLVSMIVADFDRWTETVVVDELLPGGGVQPRSMELVYYAPSSRRADAEFTWQNTGAMLQVYEELWGPYPYADVKYGNALFQGAVAMEHPTLSSIGDSPFTLSDLTSTLYPGPVGELVNAHEATHQWFGDAIRLERWGDIWLNEGFARYGEVVWLEEFYGPSYARAYRDQLRGTSDNWTGTLRDPDGLFSSVTYNRGALTLHMLRAIMGRDELYTAMRDYMFDLRFGAVTIEDFQAKCEAVYGASLDWFFEPWFSREALPRLEVEWSQVAGVLTLRVRQDPAAAVELPLPVRLTRDDGTSSDETIWVGRGIDEFTFSVSTTVTSVEIDPELDFLVEVETNRSVPGFRFDGARPNPFNAGTEIHFEVTGTTDLRIEIVDARGRRVWSRAIEDARPGADFVLWNGVDAKGRAAASGVYYVRLEGAGRTITSKVALVR